MKKLLFSLLAIVLALGLAIPLATPVAADVIDVYPGDSIQAAIDGASDGDTIIVHPGTYTGNVLVNKNVTLQSAEKYKAEIVGSDYGGDAVRITADGATVEGFLVRIAAAHDGIAVKADGVTVRSNKVTGPGPFTGWVAPTGAGISAILCDDVTIENNHVRYTNGVGLWLTITNSLISKNRIEGTQYTGILLAPWGSTYSNGNLIAENLVTNSGTVWNYDDGIRLGAGAYNNVVWGNHVTDSSRSGIRAHWNGVHDNTIVGNKMNGSQGLGVGFDAHDQSSGTRTAGTANWWAGNKFRTSDPDDLE